MTKPDLMAELPLVAYAWRKEGMVGWALGHNPPTPNMIDFDKYEVRELTFRTHHAELEAVVRDAAVLRSLAAAMYQAAGTYDMPVRFLDVLAAAGNGEAITEEQVDALLPCEEPDVVRDAAYGRALRDAMEAEYQAAKESRKDGKQEPWITTYTLLRRLKVAADHLSDHAMHNSAREG